MKQTLFLTIASLALSTGLLAQENTAEETFNFKTIKENKITSIKNQASSGTCWCYSTLSFFESELLRMGKPEVDLSEMYVVYHTYQDKLQRYVRYDGKINFSEGGAFYDIPYVIKKYGIVPDTIYKGLNYGETVNKHSELSQLLTAYADVIVKKPLGKLSTAWIKGYQGILDAYLGELPEKFTYEGVEYTPQSYAESLGLNMDDYVSITSFSHHPYYDSFIIEVPDNWLNEASYNLPLDEFCEVAESAVMNGYTIAWGSDVSESYFKGSGVAMVPDATAKEMPGSDQAHWLGLSQEDKDKKANALNAPVPEKTITPEMRQLAYNNKQTTDDHGMHIFGLAEDQNGTKYYMVKNSWGEKAGKNGIWYVSQNFFRYKTLNYMVHKDAIPKKIAKKLGL